MVRQQANRLTMFSEVRIDPLTGVTNRRGMDEALASQFAVRNRYGLELSVLIMDIDHFKRINDKQGHLEGDRMLQRVARLLHESAREVDLVVRYGGEEFVIVMPRTDLEGAAALAERIRTEVHQQLRLTISGGIATALDGDTPELLLARADAALYEAKAAGRNRVFRHDGTQLEPILEDVPAPTSV
jgi:diguanylate cyclase (GGDEF)-like protein